MMKIIRNISILLLIITAVIFILGCAGKSTELLAEDYKTMSNENILRYYYSLNDEIERQEKQSSPQFGIGIGSFGHGVGGGASVGTGGSGYTADDLRARRIDVRLELKRRNLNP
ncbi:MAG: hypothetical protein NTW65_12655 [Deltaproteobacteria bacterium]|nr:hypothetical protein [Deltaproteobacteria bacterium]